MSLILPVTQLAIWLGFNKLLCVISLLILNGFNLLHLSLFMMLKILDKNNKFYIRCKQRHVEKTQ